MQWERQGADIQVADLAAGMYQAMITTASGLVVAIPYALLLAILNGVISARAKRLEVAHETFLRELTP